MMNGETAMATLWCDNSTLCAAEGCQTAGVLRYHLGWTGAEEVAALKAGTAVHEALAVYLRQGDALQALVVLEAEYREWADRLPPTDRLAYPNVAAILRRWFATHPLASFPFVVPAGMVEVGAQALLTPEGECLCGHGELDGHTSGGSACSLCPCPEATSVVFVGRLDAAVRSRDGRWWALDHKTTGRISPEWLAAFELDSQMSGYIWLLQQHQIGRAHV